MPEASDLGAWFGTEVLPFEQPLIALLRRYIHDAAEVKDIKQEVYVRIYEAVRDGASIEHGAWPLIRTIAKNLIVDYSRRAKVVSFQFASDQEYDLSYRDHLTPERYASDRDQLRRFERAVEALPRRCREAIKLRKIEGLSQQECARRMGVSEGTLESHIHKGMRLLTDHMLGGGAAEGAGRIGRRRMFQS